MIVIMKKDASKEELDKIVKYVEERGLQVHLSKGEERTIVGLVGNTRALDKSEIELMSGVQQVVSILSPFKLVSREFHPEDTVVKVGDVEIGGPEVVLIAGPCAVESEKQLLSTAKAVQAAGAKVLRGSAFKPRTSPYSFQGLGEEGLKILKKAREETGMIVETEVMDIRTVEMVAKYVDIMRIGARNMQNFDLLKEVGKVDKPIILKRGIAASVKELLLAAEYIMSEGNKNVILCERGIRTFETSTRNTLDLGAVPVLKKMTHLPVIVDPSHAAGKRHVVPALARAGIAAGADGLIIEVHINPEEALVDGKQSLYTDQFADLAKELKGISQAIGRTMGE
jgi:3-deoxy-7-phosphoheptulonate synthase